MHAASNHVLTAFKTVIAEKYGAPVYLGDKEELYYS